MLHWKKKEVLAPQSRDLVTWFHPPGFTQVLFICLALSRDLRMCHCGQGTSRIVGPNAISPAVLSQWENGALLFASILIVLRRWISRQLSLEGSMRRWFGQYCYKKALTSCKNAPWLKLSWSEPPTGSSFSATHDWNWYWAYYQAASRALRSTGGTLAPERSLPRIAARSGTNCDVTSLSRSSRSPVSHPSDCYQRRR